MQSSDRKRVLVIDDEQLVGMMLARLLGNVFDVTAVTHPEDALARLANDRFDLILTDLKMPGQCGEEVLERIRELGLDTPVVIMSGHIEPDIGRDRLVAAGAAGFLRKPFPRKAEMERFLQQVLAESAAKPDAGPGPDDDPGPAK